MALWRKTASLKARGVPIGQFTNSSNVPGQIDSSLLLYGRGITPEEAKPYVPGPSACCEVFPSEGAAWAR
jgi:hypothetical protein